MYQDALADATKSKTQNSQFASHSRTCWQQGQSKRRESGAGLTRDASLSIPQNPGEFCAHCDGIRKFDPIICTAARCLRMPSVNAPCNPTTPARPKVSATNGPGHDRGFLHDGVIHLRLVPSSHRLDRIGGLAPNLCEHLLQEHGIFGKSEDGRLVGHYAVITKMRLVERIP